MPDAAQPEITKREALAAGPKETAAPIGLSTEQKAAHNKANELRAFQQEGKSAADAFRSNLDRAEFGKNKSEPLTAALSGAEGKLDANGNAELRPDAQRESKENFDRAKAAIDTVSQVINYTHILREAARSGKSAEEIYTKPPYLMRNAEWVNARAKALNSLLDEGGIRAKYNNELSSLSANDQRNYIEAVLGSDPELNSIIVSKMEEIRVAAERDLAPPTKSADRSRLDADRTRVEGEITGNFDMVIRAAGLTPGSPEAQALKDAITPDLKNGATSREIQDQVFRHLYAAADITNEGDYNNYANQSAIARDRHAKIGPISNEVTTLNTQLAAATDRNERRRLETRLTERERALDQLQDERDTARGQMATALTTIGLPQEQADEKLRQLSEIRGKVYGVQQPDGTRAGGISEACGRLTTKQLDLATLEGQARAVDLTQEAMTERASRIAKEAQLITEIEGVLSTSVEDLLIKRHEQLGLAETARLTKAIEEAGKAGDKWSEEALKNQKLAIKKRWIDISGKKTVTHQDQLRKDGQLIAQEGEDGVKTIYAEVVGFDTDEKREKDKIQGEMGILPSTPLTTEQQAEIDRRYKDRKEKFDKLYTDHSAAFKAKLLSDLFAARGLKQRWGIGDILNNNEWKMLDQHFGGELITALQSSKDGKDVMRKIRDSGIDIAPDSPLKWLLWAILGAAGAVGIGSAKLASSTI